MVCTTYIKVNRYLNALLHPSHSNGIGRTGVFITLHAQLERLKIEGVVDVFQFIKFARKQREGLVSCPVSLQVYCSTNFYAIDPMFSY